METFLFGVLTSLTLVAIISISRKRIRMKRVAFRQSVLHYIISNVAPQTPSFKSRKETQSSKHSMIGKMKFIQAPDNKAYWVENNIFYTADIVNGEFDPSNGKPIDAFNTPKNKLKELLFILDNLRNG